VINAGIYFADPSVFLPWMHLEGVVSMEEEVLPDLCQQGLLQGFLSDVPFLDIGIPADYRRAAQFLMSHGAARVLPTRQE
jgi:NDP-sugar pyrophosphorylase family protein